MIVSDCMARAWKKPPSALHRASSVILENHISERIYESGVAVSLDTTTGDLLKLAKNNIEKLKQRGKKVSDIYQDFCCCCHCCW